MFGIVKFTLTANDFVNYHIYSYQNHIPNLNMLGRVKNSKHISIPCHIYTLFVSAYLIYNGKHFHVKCYTSNKNIFLLICLCLVEHEKGITRNKTIHFEKDKVPVF